MLFCPREALLKATLSAVWGMLSMLQGVCLAYSSPLILWQYGELCIVVLRAVVVRNNHQQGKSKVSQKLIGLWKTEWESWGEGGQSFTVVGIRINRSSICSSETLPCFILILNYAGLSFNWSDRKLRVCTWLPCSTEMAWGVDCG